jgi:hypothetical protein
MMSITNVEQSNGHLLITVQVPTTGTDYDLKLIAGRLTTGNVTVDGQSFRHIGELIVAYDPSDD